MYIRPDNASSFYVPHTKEVYKDCTFTHWQKNWIITHPEVVEVVQMIPFLWHGKWNGKS